MTVDYRYRPDGLRLSKSVNGVLTTHVWDGMHIVLELNASRQVINRFIRGRRLIRSDHHGWYSYNARGDVVMLMICSGVVLRTYRYTAFGVQISPVAGDTNPWRFAGEYYDRETGRIYLRARFFDPRIGRFTQPDPHWNIGNMQFGDTRVQRNGRLVPDTWAIAQSGNLFVYCVNNPVMFGDPSGRFIISKILVGGTVKLILKKVGISATVGAAVGGGAQVVRNVATGNPWYHDMGGIFRAMLGGGVSGAISAVPIPKINSFVSVAVTSAAGSFVGNMIVGEINSAQDVAIALTAGAAMGMLGQGAASYMGARFKKHFSTLIKAEQKTMIGNIGNINNRQLTSIRQAIKRSGTHETLEALVERYGWSVVVSAFVAGVTTEAANELIRHVAAGGLFD